MAKIYIKKVQHKYGNIDCPQCCLLGSVNCRKMSCIKNNCYFKLASPAEILKYKNRNGLS